MLQRYDKELHFNAYYKLGAKRTLDLLHQTCTEAPLERDGSAPSRRALANWSRDGKWQERVAILSRNSVKTHKNPKVDTNSFTQKGQTGKKCGQPEKASISKMLKAIQNSGGLKTDIAKKLGVHYRTVLNYERKYKTVRQAIEEEREKLLDKCESNLYIKTNEGDVDTSKWILARLGKSRGYNEKIDSEQKIEHKGKLELETAQLDIEIAKEAAKLITKMQTEQSIAKRKKT